MLTQSLCVLVLLVSLVSGQYDKQQFCESFLGQPVYYYLNLAEYCSLNVVEVDGKFCLSNPDDNQGYFVQFCKPKKDFRLEILKCLLVRGRGPYQCLM